MSSPTRPDTSAQLKTPATWITDNFRCFHELQYQQIICANSNAQLREVSRLILADLQLSVSAITVRKWLSFPSVTQDQSTFPLSQFHSSWCVKLILLDLDDGQTLLELCASQMISAPLLQIVQVSYSPCDQFSFHSRIALRTEESKWVTESHLCFLRPPQHISKSSPLDTPSDLDEGVQSVLTLFGRGMAQVCHDLRVEELSEVEEEDCERQEEEAEETGEVKNLSHECMWDNPN